MRETGGTRGQTIVYVEVGGYRRASLPARQELARLELARTRPWINYRTCGWLDLTDEQWTILSPAHLLDGIVNTVTGQSGSFQEPGNRRIVFT
jgi:hypothetical protein